MLKLNSTSQFKKDYRRCVKRGLPMHQLAAVVNTLLIPAPLPPVNKDHALSGNWVNHQECHKLSHNLLETTASKFFPAFNEGRFRNNHSSIVEFTIKRPTCHCEQKPDKHIRRQFPIPVEMLDIVSVKATKRSNRLAQFVPEFVCVVHIHNSLNYFFTKEGSAGQTRASSEIQLHQGLIYI